MRTCPDCDGEFDLEELTHHDHEGIHRVHCPYCGHHFGTYNDHTH